MASIYKHKAGWRAQVRLKDSPAQSRTFSTKREALLWVREQEGAARPQVAATTLSDLIRQYRDASPAMHFGKDNAIARLESVLGEYRLAEMSAAVFINFAMMRRRTVSPGTVGYDLAYLTVLLKHGGALLASPEAAVAFAGLTQAKITLQHLGVTGASQERDRRPTEEELERLTRDAPYRGRYPIADMIWFAICTAMRIGEMTALRWCDVDLNRRTAVIQRRKNTANPTVIPLLVGPVRHRNVVIDPVEILQRQGSIRSGTVRVFPYPPKSVSGAFRRICQSLQIEDLCFHDFRHEGISRLFESDYTIPQVATVSGHRSWKHLQRYTQIRPESLHRN